MTALQDWLSERPVNPLNPRSLKALIRDALRGGPSDEPEIRTEPTLMGRGRERC